MATIGYAIWIQFAFVYFLIWNTLHTMTMAACSSEKCVYVDGRQQSSIV